MNLKLGVFSVLFSKQSFESMLEYVAAQGLDAIELGSGGYVGNAHCRPSELLEHPELIDAFKKSVASKNLVISALSCHGNSLHPNKSLARSFHEDLVNSIKLAERLEVPVVVTFSGLPGDHEGAKFPNWPVAPWPNDFREVLNWQWSEKIIPYWRETAQIADTHHVKLAIEPHGGFAVHTPATLMKLRTEVGEVIGANLDPSHMWWQGIEPVEAIRYLASEGAIYHFHAKDTSIDPTNVNFFGLTDMQPYGDVRDRAWVFRTVGYGHDMKKWADIISALRTGGYDGTISIEHEDGLMSVNEGFERAVNNLKQVVVKDKLENMWWT